MQANIFFCTFMTEFIKLGLLLYSQFHNLKNTHYIQNVCFKFNLFSSEEIMLIFSLCFKISYYINSRDTPNDHQISTEKSFKSYLEIIYYLILTHFKFLSSCVSRQMCVKVSHHRCMCLQLQFA